MHCTLHIHSRTNTYNSAQGASLEKLDIAWSNKIGICQKFLLERRLVSITQELFEVVKTHQLIRNFLAYSLAMMRCQSLAQAFSSCIAPAPSKYAI